MQCCGTVSEIYSEQITDTDMFTNRTGDADRKTTKSFTERAYALTLHNTAAK